MRCHTSSGVSPRLDFRCPSCNVFGINRNLRLSQEPHKILDLVLAVLVLQKLDELCHPLLRELDELSPRLTELGTICIQDVRGK
jgi:hypothetical protein